MKFAYPELSQVTHLQRSPLTRTIQLKVIIRTRLKMFEGSVAGPTVSEEEGREVHCPSSRGSTSQRVPNRLLLPPANRKLHIRLALSPVISLHYWEVFSNSLPNGMIAICDG